MEIVYTEEAKKDIAFWKKSGNITIQNKISRLIEAIEKDPYSGIGKPEPLRFNLAGCWSRRITQEHRIVYEVNESASKIEILSLKGHYK